MTMQPTHANKGPHRRPGMAPQRGDVSAMGNPFCAKNERLRGSVPVRSRSATPPSCPQARKRPIGGIAGPMGGTEAVTRRQLSLRGDSADQLAALAPCAPEERVRPREALAPSLAG